MTNALTVSRPPETAVLFLVFNRPDPTAQVFEAIRQARPPRLYVAGDGPRTGRKDEADRVSQVRAIATAVDWPCELKTLFRERNLGCKYAVSEAITWFFEQERRGIILEDDCLPHPTFFDYCEWALDAFEEKKEVWHVNGNNFGIDADVFEGNSIAFSALAQVWGWASWSDRWVNYQVNPFYLGEESALCRPRWALSKLGKILKIHHIAALKQGLDTWDYQWQVAILNAGGMVACPSSNLVSNLGDGPDATHTKGDRMRMRLCTQPLNVIEYSKIELNGAVTRCYERKMGLRNLKTAARFLSKEFAAHTKIWLKKVFRRWVFPGRVPVVIASTGRAGSTMVTNAVCRSFIHRRFSRTPAFFQRILFRAASDFVDRLSEINSDSAPVVKTHGLYRHEFKNVAKFIFIYGDPLESAMSVREMEREHGAHWVEEHIYHLQGKGMPGEIFEKDVLNYEEQIRCWAAPDNVLCVYYDDLWESSEIISRFLGFEVDLPQRVDRAKKMVPASYNKELFERLRGLAEEMRRDRYPGALVGMESQRQ